MHTHRTYLEVEAPVGDKDEGVKPVNESQTQSVQTSTDKRHFNPTGLLDSIHPHIHELINYLSASSLGAVQPSTSPAESGRAWGTITSLCVTVSWLLGCVGV